jgi:hypothetical protein
MNALRFLAFVNDGVRQMHHVSGIRVKDSANGARARIHSAQSAIAFA